MKKNRIIWLSALCFQLLLSDSIAHNTWWGPTGLIQMPTTNLVRPNETQASVFAGFGSGDSFMGTNVSFAFSDQIELSLADTTGLKSRQNSSTLFSLKYVPVTNLAFGLQFDSNDQFQNTAYSVLGSPENSVYMGLGVNFGNGGARKALLGNYSRATNDMETIFFMAGAKFDLSQWYPSLEGVLEYNGDTMSVGLGYIPKNNWDVQLDYTTSGDLVNNDQFVLSIGSRF